MKIRERATHTHITYCAHAGARQPIHPGTMVLDNRTSATLDGEDTGDLQDNIYIERLQLA
jgi:hypothetical protein